MLTIAIAIFFTFALMGALLTIGMMFHAYQDKIKAVIMVELGDKGAVKQVIFQRNQSAVIKPYQTIARRHAFQSAPLRAAA